MRRRTVILSTLGTAGLAYAATITAGALQACRPFEIDSTAMASARRIGERLIALGFKPSEDFGDTLERMRAELPEKMCQDFRSNDTVDCDGWILSKSEAEFCIRCAQTPASVG